MGKENILQHRHLDILVRNGGFQFSDTFFPYTSGEIGPYYVQSAVVMKDGGSWFVACEDFRDMIGDTLLVSNYDVISGGGTRDWMFSLPVSASMGMPHAMIYKDGKVIGADMSGKRVMHIADLNNEGSSPRDKWVPAIKGAGGEIKDIFFYVDRMEAGTQVMKDLGLRSHAVVQLNESAWDYLRKEGVVSEDVYRNLRERGTDKESRDAWARAMLRSDAGLRRLDALMGDSKTVEKARKIMNVGYPDMVVEMRERLKK